MNWTVLPIVSSLRETMGKLITDSISSGAASCKVKLFWGMMLWHRMELLFFVDPFNGTEHLLECFVLVIKISCRVFEHVLEICLALEIHQVLDIG